ncbi:MAG: hypothetical protein R3E53_11260 [Myxococcota bacterium]
MAEIDWTPRPTDWQFVTPQLGVRDVREAQAWYRDRLGCKIAWIWQEEYGAVYHGTTGALPRAGAGADRARHLLRARRERGRDPGPLPRARVPIVEEIASPPWGMREFTIEDPHGHRFRIGHSEGPVRPRE